MSEREKPKFFPFFFVAPLSNDEPSVHLLCRICLFSLCSFKLFKDVCPERLNSSFKYFFLLLFFSFSSTRHPTMISRMINPPKPGTNAQTNTRPLEFYFLATSKRGLASTSFPPPPPSPDCTMWITSKFLFALPISLQKKREKKVSLPPPTPRSTRPTQFYCSFPLFFFSVWLENWC